MVSYDVDFIIKEYGYYDKLRYSADKGQQIHDYNQTAKGRPLKIGNDHAFAAYIEHIGIVRDNIAEVVQNNAGKRLAHRHGQLTELRGPVVPELKLHTYPVSAGFTVPLCGLVIDTYQDFAFRTADLHR